MTNAIKEVMIDGIIDLLGWYKHSPDQHVLVTKDAKILLDRLIEQIQKECPHTNAQKKHRADTGNYDPSSDCYWTEFTCSDCGKMWSEEGSK